MCSVFYGENSFSRMEAPIEEQICSMQKFCGRIGTKGADEKFMPGNRKRKLAFSASFLPIIKN